MIARSIICVAGYHLSCAGKGLPDDGAVGGVEPHLVAGLDAEGVKEGVDVPQRGVHTVAADGVGVTLGLLEDGFLSHVVGPDAAIAQVEALRGRETVNLLVLAELLRGAESIVGDAQTTLVGDVLTQGQVAIGVLILYNNDLVKLCSELFGSLLESLAVLLGPPVGHVAILVKHTALVVKSVGHLVADNHADSTEVGGIVGLHIKEGRLQDGGGEADFVGGGVVVGIHSLRCHAPLVTVNGFAHLVKVAAGLIQTSGLDVVIQALARVNGQTAVVAPLVGITDLDSEGVELHKGVDLGLLAHPGQAGDMGGQ